MDGHSNRQCRSETGALEFGVHDGRENRRCTFAEASEVMEKEEEEGEEEKERR